MSFNPPPFAAHTGGQNEMSMMGVVGTLGTADTGGTAQILPIAVDPATGALYVNDLASSGGTQPVSGTMTVIGNVAAGTTDSGNGVKVSGVYQGTLGTLISGQRGDIQLDASSIQMMNNAYKLDSVNDSISVPTGTINAGTFTLNSKPGSAILSYGTVSAGTAGTLIAAAGTGTAIYVTGFSIDGDVTALGTPDIVLSFGTVLQGAGVLFRGQLATTASVFRDYTFPVSANLTNSPLTWQQTAGAGTIAITVQYFIQ